MWGQTLRAPIPAAVGRFDLAAVKQVGVVAQGQKGHVWVLGLSGYRSGLRAMPKTPLPRLDVRTVETPEGDAANAVARLPVRLDSDYPEPVVASIEVLGWDGTTEVSRLRFTPGEVRQVLRFPYEGDTRDDIERRAWSVTAFALKNVVVREPLGAAVVVDDDPPPSVTVSPVAEDVVEGDALRWTVELSDPADHDLVVFVTAAADPLGRSELSSADVPRRWLRQQARVPDNPTPLHELGLQLVVFLPAGATSSELRVPTSVDSFAEGSEWLTLEFADENGNPVAPALSGQVSDV
jgi:hypothetical protein